MTLEGWKRLEDLEAGDRLAVPRRVPAPLQTQRMVDDEVILLAHMIGDGSCVRNQPIRYASIDEQNLKAVANAAKHFGVTAKRDDYPAARVTTLRLPAPYHLTHGKRNPIAAWLDGFGLFGKRSYDKFVPAEVFATPNDQVALFLRHLWATDGCIWWDAKQRRVGSTTARRVDNLSMTSGNCFCGWGSRRGRTAPRKAGIGISGISTSLGVTTRRGSYASSTRTARNSSQRAKSSQSWTA